MGISDIIKLFSGIALFLFGMSLMGDGLKKVAGSKLELVLYRLSSTPWKGLLLGTGVTSVIQSSCATSVMVVGFVNSGMMQVRQAIGVILGSILGTSITGWVISLSYLGGGTGWVKLLSTATLTGVIAVAGIILYMFCKKPGQKHLGGIFLGFAVLMTGMQTMSGSVSGLKESAGFVSVLTAFQNPAMGILAGAVFTAILQSASAAVGILQALSVTGAINCAMALPLLLGIGIGASVPVMLSAIGANIHGRRTAFVYPVAEVISVIIFGTIFYLIHAIRPFGFMDDVVNPFSVAMVNSVSRLVKVLMLMPFVNGIEKLVITMIKQDKEETTQPLSPEDRFLQHPAVALEQTRNFLRDMAALAGENLQDAFALLVNYTEAGYKKVEELEGLEDKYEDALGNYLVKLNQRELSPKQNRDVTMFLHTISDFERISDHAMNIAKNAQEIHRKGIIFTETAMADLHTAEAAITDIMDRTVLCFVNEDVSYAKTVEPLEELIDDLCDELKLRHVERIQRGECTLQHGFVFNDLITNLERISDHCSNVAVAVISLEAENLNSHEYLSGVKEKRSARFEELYEQYSRTYRLSDSEG